MRIGQALNPPALDPPALSASEVPAMPQADPAEGSAPVMQPPESLKATGLSPTGVTDLVLKHLMLGSYLVARPADSRGPG